MPSIDQVNSAKAEASKRAESLRLARMSGRKRAAAPLIESVVDDKVEIFVLPKVEAKVVNSIEFKKTYSIKIDAAQAPQPQAQAPQAKPQESHYLQHIETKDNSVKIEKLKTEFFYKVNQRKFNIPLIVKNILLSQSKKVI